MKKESYKIPDIITDHDYQTSMIVDHDYQSEIRIQEEEKQKPIIYMDNAATTKVDPVACSIIRKQLENYINPSAIYPQAQSNQDVIKQTKKAIARIFNINYSEEKAGDPDATDIYFTSCGSESDTWAITGLNFKPGDHVIVSAFEHHAILRAAQSLCERQVEVSYIKPRNDGLIYVEDISKLIRKETKLVSIMAVNNVVGTVQPIKEIGYYCKNNNINNNIIFHTDAVQAISHIPIDVQDMHIDMMSCSGHKIHCPRGIGFLYVNNKSLLNNGMKLNNIIYGGGQNNGHRPGTENHPYIAALGYCLNKYCDPINMELKRKKCIELSDYLRERLTKEFTCLHFNGILDYEYRVPVNINLSFKDIISDPLVYDLGVNNICISKGSACDNGGPKEEEAYVLVAMRIPEIFWQGMIRITLNEDNTKEEIDILIDNLKRLLKEYRGYV